MERTGLWRVRLLLETMFEIWQLGELDVQSSFALCTLGFSSSKSRVKNQELLKTVKQYVEAQDNKRLGCFSVHARVAEGNRSRSC